MHLVRSLTGRIILQSLVLLACLFAAIVAGGAYYQQAIVREMDAKSSEILKGVQVRVSSVAEEPLEDLLIQLREQQEVDAIVLFNQDLEVAASARSSRLAGSLMDTPGLGLQIRRLEGPDGPLTAYVQTLPIEAAGEVVGYVNVALAIAPQTAILQAFRSRLLWALIAVFCLTTLALCYTVASALRPLRQLSEHLADVGEGRLESVNITANSSEVSVLQERFNAMVAALREKAAMADRLRQSQRLTAMGNLAAGIAHDIGNPLNALKLTSSHLKDVLAGDAPASLAEAQRYAAAMGSEVERLDRLVRDFLTLAREQPPQPAPHALDAVVDGVLHLVRAEARRRRITLAEDLGALDTRVAIDANQVKGAIVNILVNAFDAAGEGGRVEVSTARDNGQVRIAVRDSGPGIPPEVQARMFEPYFTTKPDGTGLGLALTRSVIEQHGGRLEVESGPDRGTTMTIVLGTEPALGAECADD